MPDRIKTNQIPQLFSQRMQIQLGDEYTDFTNSLDLIPPVSLRLHPVKGKALFFDPNSLSSIPWCKNGFYLDQRPVFTLDPSFHAGAYYVQEASSMIIDYVLRKILTSSNVKILDLCAAPGGKSTLISSILNGDGLLVSNETISSRASSLHHNLLKWGYANQIITIADPEKFKALKGFFDIIVVDAPCSGEGLFRKDPESRKEWSEKNASHCALRQSRILDSVKDALKPSGFLIYSTCTYNPDENSKQMQSLVKSGWTCIDFAELKEWGFEELNMDGVVGYQAYPHKVKGEGFFISIVKKPTGTISETALQRNTIHWIKKPPIPEPYLYPDQSILFFTHNQRNHFISNSCEYDLEILSRYLRVYSAGTAAGEFKGTDFIPDHSLSQSIHLHPEIESKSLTKEEAILFLKRISPANINEQRGYILSSYNHHPLGWLKGIQGRFNNIYPNEYRIKGNFD